MSSSSARAAPPPALVGLDVLAPVSSTADNEKAGAPLSELRSNNISRAEETTKQTVKKLLKSGQQTMMNSLRKHKAQRAAQPSSSNQRARLSFVECPSCNASTAFSDINEHLDDCLSRHKDVKYLPTTTVAKAALESLKNQAAAERDAEANDEKDIVFADWRPTFKRKVEHNVTSSQDERKGAEVAPGQATEDKTPCVPRIWGPYYLRAFVFVLDCVLSRHKHLFTDAELTIADDFHALPQMTQCLYARLYKRKHAWLSAEDLCYNDLDVPQALTELEESGFCIPARGESTVEECADMVRSFKADKIRALAVPLVKKKAALSRLDAEKIVLAQLKRHQSRTIDGISLAELMRKRVMEAASNYYRVEESRADFFTRLHKLFFVLQPTGDSAALILADLGRMEFAPYVCRISAPLFDSRDDFVVYLRAGELERRMEESLAAQDYQDVSALGATAEAVIKSFNTRLQANQSSNGVDEAKTIGEDCHSSTTWRRLRHPFYRRLTAEWRYASIAWHSVAVQERCGEHEAAVQRLRTLLASGLTPARRGKMLNRLSIDLQISLGRPQEALEVCTSALLGGEAEEWWSIQRGERLQLVSRARRLWRQTQPRGALLPTPLASALLTDNAAWTRIPEKMLFGRPLDEHRRVGGASVFIGYDDKPVSVEELCLQSYRAEANWRGVHAEGGPLRALFGLFMWEQLFADVPDVFHTPFQDAPLDLGTEAFYTSRRLSIDARLSEIVGMTREQLSSTVRDAYRRHYGVVCRGVNWPKATLTSEGGHDESRKGSFVYEEANMSTVASCVGGRTLSSAFRLLCLDYSYWAGGLPDLLLWKGHEECMFVEVKGPRDSLNARQRSWLHELLASEARVEVCRVVERVTRRNESKITGDHDGHRLKRLHRDHDENNVQS